MTLRHRTAPSMLLAVALVAAAVALRYGTFGATIWSIDEGVTFTIAQQIKEGDVLYRDAVDHRPPLVPYLKAGVFAIAGDWNVAAVRFLVAVSLGLGAVLLWRLCRRLGDERAGVWAALVHLIAAYVYVFGDDSLSANTGWFLAFFSTLGFAAFVWALEKPGLLRGGLVGLSFGLAILCKQPALLDFGVTWILLAIFAAHPLGRAGSPQQRQPAVALLAVGCLLGAALPFAVFAAYFAAQGVWSDFVYYAYTYNADIYVPAVPFEQRWRTVIFPFQAAWQHLPVLGGLAILGTLGLLASALRAVFGPSPSGSTRDRLGALLPWLILGWCASGLVSATLSGRTFMHYLTQLVPGLSLAAGWMLARLQDLSDRAAPRLRRGLLVMLAAGFVLTGGLALHRARSATGNGSSPDEAYGATLASFTSPAERIFIWGYFPDYHLFARRLPSTRFLYSNFLTGFIPWENSDPLLDTSATETPGAWDALHTDFVRRPPALILELLRGRAQTNYPLHARPALAEVLRRDYAEVAYDSSPANHRIYRRLQSPLSVAPPDLAKALPDPAITLAGWNSRRAGDSVMVEVTAPAGFDRLELLADERLVATLPHPVERPVRVRFFTDPGLRTSHQVQVAAHASDGLHLSPVLDLQAYAHHQRARRPRGPLIDFAGVSVAPCIVETAVTNAPVYHERPGTHYFVAPARLVYPFPGHVETLRFEHGIVPFAMFQSDGYDLVMTWRPRADAGTAPVAARRVWLSRVRPQREGRYQGPQSETVHLPDLDPGFLEFTLRPGSVGEPHMDHVFFGRLTGEISGAWFAVGNTPVPLLPGPDGHLVVGDQLEPGQWVAHAPTAFRWRRPELLAEFRFGYGIEAGAYAPERGPDHTDGVTFRVELIPDKDGPTQVLFEKHLDPFALPEDRGEQTAHVAVPPAVPGTIVARTLAGPHENSAWDWSWMGRFEGRANGPPLRLPDGRQLLSIGRSDFQNGRAHEFRPGLWAGHAPQELVYPKPAELRGITIHYGISAGAATDANGRRRSDGVVTRVAFRHSDGTETELLRRELDPFARPADYGLHEARLGLPEGEIGELIFRTDPGPAGDNSFDWSIWGEFSGEIVMPSDP